MREFVTDSDCEALFEGFTDLVGTIGSTIRGQASEFVNAEIVKFHPQLSTALPASGTSPNFHVRLAAASESIYLALSRRMITSVEEEEGYWTVFHKDALGIIEEIKSGDIRLDPDPSRSLVGIGVAEGVVNGTVAAPTSSWAESNSLLATSYYQDDMYSRTYTVEIDGIGDTLKESTFRWKTNMTVDKDWEGEGIQMNVLFTGLSYGVAVRWLNANFSSFAVGQQWEIACYPERDSKNKAIGIETHFMERG